MRIRKAKPEDAKEICKMHRLIIKKINSRDYSKDQIEAWSSRSTPERTLKSINNPRIFYYVAIENDKIVGYCDFDKNSELRGLYIHPDYMGVGVGKKILRRAEKDAKKIGLKYFKLISTITAFEFYKKMGFRKTRIGKHKIGKHKLDIYHMRKDL